VGVVLITGCSSGFGRRAAIAVARRGHAVFASMRAAADRREARELRETAEAEGLELVTPELDVTSETSVDTAVERIVAETGRIDVAVNNAGVPALGPAEAFTPARLREILDVNLFGPARVNRAVLPHMRRRGGGLLVHVTSILGRLGLPFFGAYAASKFGLEALAEAYRHELAPLGIDSVIVEPGPYPTETMGRLRSPDDGERVEGYTRVTQAVAAMLDRFNEIVSGPSAPDPREVAEAIADLIDRPLGERPLRTVTGVDFGVAELNEAAAPHQRTALETLGLDG